MNSDHGQAQNRPRPGPELQAILQAVQTAIDATGDAVELIAIGQGIEPAALPEPGRRLGGPLRLLQQLRQLQQALIAKQPEAALAIVAAPGDLDQPAPAITLTVAIGLGGVAQACRERAGVVLAQVLITAQLAHVLQLPGFVTDLGQERRLALRRIDLPMGHGGVEWRNKNARLAAGVRHDLLQLLFGNKHVLCL